MTYTLGEETHTLPLRSIVTHTTCDPDKLRFEKAGASVPSLEPRNGDRFIVRTKGSGITVAVERK